MNNIPGDKQWSRIALADVHERRYSPVEKVKILREHLEDQVPLSQLSERHRINLNELYKWKKQLFEGAVDVFTRKQNGSVLMSERENERPVSPATTYRVLKSAGLINRWNKSKPNSGKGG